ncbi:MAG: hypothetical protein ACKO5K_05595, partial [Armatimonadota bacterium]
DLQWKRAAAPFRDLVRALLVRRTTPQGHGFADLETARIAARCAAIVAAEMGWPNDRFVPEDPAATLFWAHEDGLDATAAVMAIEAEWGIHIDDTEFLAWIRGDWGRFVANVTGRVRESTQRPIIDQARK